MPYSVNTRCLFPGMPLEQVFAHLNGMGFHYVEDWTIPREEVAVRAALMRAHGMKMTAFCPRFFILNDLNWHDEYEESLKAALEDARILGSPALITQVGNDTGAPRQEQHRAIVIGLKRMAPTLEQAGVTLLVEPLNNVKDHPGYYLTDSGEGFDIVREVGSPYVKLLYDVYHQVYMGEDVLTRIKENSALIGHFHIAAHPDRDEKLFDLFDYTEVLSLIKCLNTAAPVGIELFPSSKDAADAVLLKLLPLI